MENDGYQQVTVEVNTKARTRSECDMSIHGEGLADDCFEDGTHRRAVPDGQIFGEGRVQVGLHKVIVVYACAVRNDWNVVGFGYGCNAPNRGEAAAPLQLRLNHVARARGEYGGEGLHIKFQIPD